MKASQRTALDHRFEGQILLAHRAATTERVNVGPFAGPDLDRDLCAGTHLRFLVQSRSDEPMLLQDRDDIDQLNGQAVDPDPARHLEDLGVQASVIEVALQRGHAHGLNEARAVDEDAGRVGGDGDRHGVILSGLGFGGASAAARLEGGLQRRAHRPDGMLVEVEAVGVAGVEGFQKEMALRDLQEQRITLGSRVRGWAAGHVSIRSVSGGAMHPLNDTRNRSIGECNQLN